MSILSDITLNDALAMIDESRDVVIFTALGPEDPELQRLNDAVKEEKSNKADVGKIIGDCLGELTREIMLNKRSRRILVCGGDTSGSVTKHLDILGLEMSTLIAPGAPLCRCYSDKALFDGLEIVLKSGQFGQEDFFGRVKEGKAL
ncbi:MAG: hypothetical protein HPY66_3375 [Firmicutes bacterium]|nr:hypothetical protein [Bacillota bacterium]MDI6706281.1 nucleotide-binding domain containing protein [Bacillota bacterium]